LVQSPGLPGSCGSRSVPAMEIRVTPAPSSFGASGSVAGVSSQPRCPSCASRCGLRVAPLAASSGTAGDGGSSCLVSPILSALEVCACLELPPCLRRALCASQHICGFPRRVCLPALPATELRVAPSPVSFSPACLRCFGFPRCLARYGGTCRCAAWVSPCECIFRLCRRRVLQVAPNGSLFGVTDA